MTVDRLYFAQHGLAVDKVDDPERPLSEQGIRQSTQMATQLHDAKVAISCIFHSGKLRALQTAEIFAKQLAINPVSAVDYLSANNDVRQSANHLDSDAALFIGHLPHLDKLTAYLLTGNENNHIINFQNSGVLCLENDQAQYHIQWYITPDMPGNL